jgi:hypothetical protein
MATLRDRETREQTEQLAAAATRHHRDRLAGSSGHEQAKGRLREAFATFDGSDAGYVACLTGVSGAEMRCISAI